VLNRVPYCDRRTRITSVSKQSTPKICRARKNDIMGIRLLCNNKLHDLYSIAHTVKSRGLKWAGHVEDGDARNIYGTLVRKHFGRLAF
jgi:hypothetical protein